MPTTNFADFGRALALPLAMSLALAGCGTQEAEEVGQAETAMTEEPGVDGAAVTAGEARSEAAALAGRIASGELEQDELAVALEDLDRLVNDNPVDFPADMRPSLTEDIQSARTAMESQDSEALQEAAASIQTTLSGSDAASTAS
ncbi:MAG: hypothetical protein GW854_02070 [Erythrobacter sp.]|nr:hypothetical protein [Erythrobacter sp.]